MAGTPLSGRYASVRLGTASIDLLGRWEVVISFDEAEASEFGSIWKKNIPTLSSWRGTLEGLADASSSSGKQIIGLFNAALDQTLIKDIRFYLQSSSGIFLMPNFTTEAVMQSTDAGAYISNVRYGQDKSGLASFGCDVAGYGPLAMFLTTSSGIIAESSL